jgi:hypothetical protein
VWVTHGEFARASDVGEYLRVAFEQSAKGGCRACCPVLKHAFLVRLVYGGSVPPVSVARKLAKNSDAAVILWVRVPSLAVFSGLVFGAGPCCLCALVPFAVHVLPGSEAEGCK